MPGPELLKISVLVNLLLQNLLPLEFLYVLLGLKCYLEESTGTKTKIENVINLFVPLGALKSLQLSTYIVHGFILNLLKVLAAIDILELM